MNDCTPPVNDKGSARYLANEKVEILFQTGILAAAPPRLPGPALALFAIDRIWAELAYECYE
ncbi:hypothetical protein SAMN05216404_105236 [Nitrosospira multiformis]|uniref:Uncharacterized protein n=1 Tax=Nitrosospira multiformis TaxID=1231 RepID=A0A1H8HUV7_9PROT|nr:hypothetical protein SAMN05216404_105236 [Nitrosospira multiformis]